MEVSCHTCVQDENGRFPKADRKKHFSVLEVQEEETKRERYVWWQDRIVFNEGVSRGVIKILFMVTFCEGEMKWEVVESENVFLCIKTENSLYLPPLNSVKKTTLFIIIKSCTIEKLVLIITGFTTLFSCRKNIHMFAENAIKQ